MEIYPAIDLMNNEVVRIYQGKPSTTFPYSHFGSPLEVAQRWVDQGAEMLHIIDLDATLGRGSNLSILRDLLDSVSVPIQFGGGIRDEKRARYLLDLGISRVILGTIAIRNPQLVIRLGE